MRRFWIFINPNLFCNELVSHGTSLVPYVLAIQIPGFHPGGLGSTPSMGTHFSLISRKELLRD